MKMFVKLFAALNLGDDLFLKILLERYPTVNFVLSAPEVYRQVFRKYENLSVIQDTLTKKRGFFQKVYGVIERNITPKRYQGKIKIKIEQLFHEKFPEYRGFISIGGSIFMQPKKLPVYADIEYYRVINKKFENIFFIGCNFGPFNDTYYRENYRSIFKNASDVCFREKMSWQLFSELDNVRYRPDVVFGLDYPEAKKITKSVGFSVISARNNIDKNSYIKKYVELVKFYQSKNYKIYFFSFCKKQGDEAIINEIIELLDNKNSINKIFYNGDIDAFLKIYSSVEKMFCGRFHAMILSMLFNQQIYPVIYSKKMTNVLDDINYKGNVILMKEFYKINPSIIYNEIGLNHYNIQEQKSKSKEQFEMLDLFLKKNKI